MLLNTGVKIAFVTHLQNFAGVMSEKKRSVAAFLRAKRKDDGRRSVRIIPSAPFGTGYGHSLYEEIFAVGDVSAKDRTQATG